MATYVGIDIAKHGFDLAFEPKQKIQHVDNDAKGIGQCCKVLKKLEPELVVMKPTGGYEMTLMIQRYAKGFSVAKVNARKIRDFARASGLERGPYARNSNDSRDHFLCARGGGLSLRNRTPSSLQRRLLYNAGHYPAVERQTQCPQRQELTLAAAGWP